jgi:hypothetical protein
MTQSQGDDAQAGAVDPAVPQRLYLHIGMAKSGSTFLQSVLGRHRATLKAHGYVYPYVRQEGMFHAAVEMAGKPEYWGLDPDDIRGTFAHLLRRGRRLGGTIVISHELFGMARSRQLEAIGEALAGFDVHLVVTVRNTGRTITAQWQETVKNGRRESFEEFTTDLLSTIPEGGGTLKGFWRPQNLGWLLERWRPLVPPERTHVVVTPVQASGPAELWNRFAEAIEFPADAVDLSQVPRSNESLGVPQIAFLRQVLDALDDRLEQPWFSRVAKRWFAQTLLGSVPAAKPVTPAEVAERLTGVTQEWIEFVRANGYHVYGDLDELLPELPPAGTRLPDDVTPDEMLEGLPGVVAEMLVRTRDLSVTIKELESQNRALSEERDHLAAEVAELTDQAERRRRWWPF